MKNKIKKYLNIYLNMGIITLVLISLIIGFTWFKVTKIKKNPHFRNSHPGSLYYSENAFHYRSAKIIATEKHPVYQLTHDVKTEHPEETNLFKHYTIFMEFIVGFAYRMVNFGIPFNLYLIYFQSFFSSLSILAVFLIGKKLFKSYVIGLAASLVYISTPASFTRMIPGIYLREDFALFFLLLSIYLFIKFLENQRARTGIVTGLAVAVALASWHVSQFFYLCMMPYFFWLLSRYHELLKKLFIIAIILMLAGIIIPVLRANSFIFSPLMCCLYAVCLGVYFPSKYAQRSFIRFIISIGVFIILLILTKISVLYGQSYSHVYSLILFKIRFLLQKPDNPLLLPFEVRQLWEGNFNTPSFREFTVFGKLTLPVGLILSVWIIIKAKRESTDQVLIAYLACIFFLISVFIGRVLILSVPFLAIVTGKILSMNYNKNFIYPAFGVLLIVNFKGINLNPIIVNRYNPHVYQKLFSWIEHGTSPDEAFVGHMAISPMILLNTDRPQVLHSKFENLPIRKRNENFIKAVFSENEEQLYSFCVNNKVTYLVFDAMLFFGDGKDSERYKVGAVNTISEKAMASRLFFADTTLQHFVPVYQNLYFAVFKVIEKKEIYKRKMSLMPSLAPLSVFRKENGYYKDTFRTFSELIQNTKKHIAMAENWLKRNNPKEAIKMLKNYVIYFPQYSVPVYLLALAYIRAQQPAQAEQVIHDYLKYKTIQGLYADEFEYRLLEMKADLLFYRLQYDESYRILQYCLKLPYLRPSVYLKLGTLHKRKKEWAQAVFYYSKYLENVSLPLEVVNQYKREIAELKEKIK